MRKNFKNSAIYKLFHDVVHDYHILEFNIIYGQIEMIDLRAARYLLDMRVDREARSHSSGKRFNIMTI